MNENNITTSDIKVKQWLMDGEKVWCRPVHPGVPDSEAGIWAPATEYKDGWEFLRESDRVQMATVTTPEEVLTPTEYKSLVNIMAFFDWDTFKKLETLDYNDGDKDLDLDAVKEYVIDTFEHLVMEARAENLDYRWSEGIYSLRFEYKKDVGLHLMYVPVQEGDD